MTGTRSFIFFYLLRAHFTYTFGSPHGRNKKLFYSATHLFSKQSFRLPESARHDVLIILRTWLYTARTLFSARPELKNTDDGTTAAFDSSFEALKERCDYLRFFDVKVSQFYSRDHLSGSPDFFAALLHFGFISLLLPFLLPFSFSKHRACYALLLRESIEWCNLITLLRKNNSTQLYFFSVYEKDANFLALLLNANGIKVRKITSEVPLVFANKIIVADELCLCFAYQEEEMKAFKETIFCDNIRVWIPEMMLTYSSLYSDKKMTLPSDTIGFYSSAYWLRKKLNHSIAGVGSYDAEEELLRQVLDYLSAHPQLNLLIFRHPLEKKHAGLCAPYYQNLIDATLTNRVSFAPQEVPSTQLFHHINIGISLFSTIMFERLSLGFKSILCPLDKKDFPLESSPFRNICAYNKEQLFFQLDKNISLSAEQFFTDNNISAYKTPYISVDCTLS